ncbi:hypothetical protein QEV69_08980 [Trueperella pyogenes]|uniref:NUDIX hydrolase n=1 Tax=Trueperella pyogenes TaxID=1661 RepID=A0ABV3NC08_9ACTO|nr:hypothetical protein [Trueperella pyogenes]AHU88808.1 hypothetical protein CQ11_00840 [Trueperella pyogenes]AWA42683.1 hypothetical protein DBV13_00835 [Trueperella pyogenes]AZR00354.1 hypothetical protein EB776_03000 [Trueperella pyogenes]AZR03403.1 hypothetical protein EB775_08885 [Trueperella pyogenes]MBB3024716.1 hypothetical protein [Trueperella pyogenes]
MIWWYVLLAVGVLGVGVVASFLARSLDRIHKNVMKSRVALERALTDRAQAALHVAQSGALDAASSIVLADLAIEAIAASVYPIVDDGLDAISIGDDAVLAGRESDPPDRLSLESELSRALRHSVDQLECGSGMEDLERARVAVQMTRRFHNNHVAQARRVRKNPLVRLLHLQGHAPEPQMVNLDDREDR